MTDHPIDEEREALIAGDRAGSLAPDEAAELSLLAHVLADASTWAEPSDGLEDSVVAAVRDADAGPVSSAAPSATAAARRPVRRRHRVLLSAAAAVLVVVAVGAIAVRRASPTVDYRAQLAATALAPSAAGSVDVTRNEAGFSFTLDASGLPPLQDGEYYQAWLKSKADTLVPIGSFSSSDDQVVLWSGVNPADYPTMTVTIEAPDNNQASSGRRVLVGDVRPA